MVVLDLLGLIAVLGSAGVLGYLVGRAAGRREGARDEAAALRRSLLLDLQSRASLDPALERQFVDLVTKVLDAPERG